MKDRGFLLFTFLLSFLIGGAEAFSVNPADVHRTIYPFIETKTGQVFEAHIASESEKNFETLLTGDTTVLSSGNQGQRTGNLPKYYLLGTRQVTEIRPYVMRFFQGFLFVWMIYLVVGYLVKHLVIREFKQSLTRKRKPRRRK